MSVRIKHALGYSIVGLIIATILGIIGWMFATAITEEYGIQLVYSSLIIVGGYGLVAGIVFLLKYLLED